MAKLTFALTLLVLICGANSTKLRVVDDVSSSQLSDVDDDDDDDDDGDDDEGQALTMSLSAQLEGGLRKSCHGVHSVVSNVNAAANNASQAGSIPRIIHVTFKSIEELPACVADSFQKLNPNFEVQKWGDKEIIKFLQTHFTQTHADFFCSIPAGEIKSDFFRVAALWKLGGWYLDMDVGLKQPLDKIADPAADMILPGSIDPVKVNPIILGAKPGNEVLLRTLKNMLALHGSKYDYWGWSICVHLWKTLNEEFAGKFAPSNVVAMKTSPKGLKVQMMKEEFCSFGKGTMSKSLIADNNNGCQPGLTLMR